MLTDNKLTPRNSNHKKSKFEKNQNKRIFLKQRLNLAFFRSFLFILFLIASGGYFVYRGVTVFSATPIKSYEAPSAVRNTEMQAKRQTMQLVNLTKKLQKDPTNATLIQQVEALAASRKIIIRSLIANYPKTAIQIQFPSDLVSGLPAEVQTKIEHAASLSGQLSVIHGHQVNPKTSEFTNSFFNYDLVDPGGKHTKLHFSDDGPSNLGGDIVKVNGLQLEDVIAINSTSSDVSIVTDSTVSTAAVNKKIAVILFNFADNNSQPWTTDEVKTAVFGDASPSVDTYYQEQSFGQIGVSGKQSADGDIFGWYSLSDTSASCNYTTWATHAQSAAAAAGVDLNAYDDYVYAFPATSSCNFGGLGDMPGNRIWINGYATNSGVISHELGHNFGANHASSDVCKDLSGAPVTISDNCIHSEYGDDFDVMGNASAEHHMNAYQKGELNYLQAANTQTITSSGTYTIAPIETVSSGVQSLRIPFSYNPYSAQPDYYYLEYRQPIGYDSSGSFATNPSATQGVLVHIAPDYSTRTQSLLLDMTPGTDWFDVALTAGNTFTDSTHGVSVTTTNVSSTGATVQITDNPPPCVRANPTVNISPVSQWGNAGDTLTYSVNIFNNDSTNCLASNFDITSTMPTGLSQTTGTIETSVAPGTSVTMYVSVDSSSVIAAGYYTFTENVTNASVSSYKTSVSANYNVYQPADTFAPSATLSSPKNGVTVSGSTNVIGSASDNVGIASSELYIDGLLRATSSNGNLTFSWNTTNETNGTHTLTFKAYDAAGNTGTSSVSVNVSNVYDITAPAVTINNPANGATAGNKVTINASAKDNIGVTKVQLYIDGLLTASSASGSISYNWNTQKISKGAHTITVKAYDAAGNVGTGSVNVIK